MPNISVIGDGIVDVYLQGEIRRLNPEYPQAPLVNILSEHEIPGGAYNVANNLWELGNRSKKDFIGQGPIKTRLLVGTHMIARWDEYDECPEQLPEYEITPDAIVVSDYGKGAVTHQTIANLLFKSCPIFIDTKHNPQYFCQPDAFYFPNEKEYNQYPEYQGLKNVVRKLGPAGASFQGITIPAFNNAPVSVCGAGDSFLAGFVKRYLETNNPIQALVYANAAAAAAIAKKYTSIVSERDVAEYLRIYES